MRLAEPNYNVRCLILSEVDKRSDEEKGCSPQRYARYIVIRFVAGYLSETRAELGMESNVRGSSYHAEGQDGLRKAA